MNGWPSTKGLVLPRFLPSRLSTLAAIVLVWAIVAVIATTTAFIALRGSNLSQWLAIFQPMTVYYAVWVVISLVIYWLVEALSGSPARRVYGVIAHLAFFALLAVSLPFVVHFGDWRTWLYGDRAVGFHTLAAFIYFLNLVGSYLIRFYRLSVERDREVREARLRASLLENQLNLARMDALKMQINPHFLFNALNSIAALIETERKIEAYHATELLGGLLRSSLDQSGERMLPLAQEVEFVQRYIDMEKVRFGERIQFATEIDDNCLDADVPILILQPLIENAIKHSISRTADKIRIVLTASMDDEHLHIALCDDGPGLATDSSEGYGLANTRKRLELMYGDAFEFNLADGPSGGACATLRLPLRPAH